MDVSVLVLCALLSAVGCSAEKGELKTNMKGAAGSTKSVTLQPWLVGLTAVVVFLFILFTILIVHRLLKKNRSLDLSLKNRARAANAWDYEKAAELDNNFKQTNL